MGGPMAGHLVARGMDVTVWNRTSAKAEPLRQAGAKVAESLAQVGSECDVVFTCVGGSQDVMECVSAMADHAKTGTVFVDHSTIAPEAARNIHHHLEQKGMGFIDAPITGGSVGAQKGLLTIFAGGTQEDYDRVVELMAPYTKRIEHVGGPGQGQMMKLANQVAVAGALLALCESLAFAERAGLDISLTRDMLSGGAAGSWAFDNYGPKILSKDWSPGFSVRNQQKDLLYCLETARELGMALPGTDLVHQLLSKLQQEGRDEEATAALFDVLVQS